MAMKDQPTPREGAGHEAQSGGHSRKFGSGQSPISSPVAGHTTGGGVSYGLAEHHQRAGEGGPHKFDDGSPQRHFYAEHHKATPHALGTPHMFCGTSKSGQLRVSGVKGAHRIGKK